MISSDYTRVKEALDIVDIAGRFVTLKKKGSNYVGVCPFHDDHSPSMMVSPARQTYKCWSCGAGGDVIEFVKQHEHYANAYEALGWCAKEAGIQIGKTELTPEEIAKQKEIESERIAIEASCSFFEDNLPAAAGYLKQRGYEVGDDVLKTFRIGYAPEGNMLYRELTGKGHTFGRLAKVNVCNISEKGFKYDVFRDRITFPFLDLHGRVAGFSGRLCTPRENTGKYLNTADTDIFSKKSSLFGLFQAKKSISKTDSACLVEGQFDVLAFHETGLTNTVGTSGTAFTIEQLKLLKRFTKNVTLCFDGDEAGGKALAKSCELLLTEGFTVRCVLLPKGKDPDDIAREQKDDTPKWISNHTCDFLTYFTTVLVPLEASAEQKEQAIEVLIKMLAAIPSATLRLGYLKAMAVRFEMPVTMLERRLNAGRLNMPENPAGAMKPGIYGLDMIPGQTQGQGRVCLLTDSFATFIESVDDMPVVFINGIPALSDVQQLRKTCSQFETGSKGLSINEHGEESQYLQALAAFYRAGMTSIKVNYPGDDYDDGEIYKSYGFILYYCKLYGTFFSVHNPADRSEYIGRCADLLSYADDSARIVNLTEICTLIGLKEAALKEILKPYIAKRKSRIAVNAQRTDDSDEEYDPDSLPAYVDENPEYRDMYRHSHYYPHINAEGEPVYYMFQNKEKSGHTPVGDFYMIPLLHIDSAVPEENKRVLKINRRYFKTPLYIEVQSKVLLRKSTIEEYLINLEAVNFTDGEEKHWTRIKEHMSRRFIKCFEIKTYGNQQTDGSSKLEKKMFYAFANGIFHIVDGLPRFDAADELGVVTHHERNYYLPAFSSIYLDDDDSDRYENISKLKFHTIPVEKQCSFEHWADLMDRVYKLNDNGKWALLYAVMCAFRSNIHCIDRLFTAPFFMGPMSSGKTQIAISIRSLFISPRVPIFNLNIGTDAAMSTLMSTFRDVPVVLDEYNNKDISDGKFQALKGIVYDGDGKQKRKGVGGNEIENDKVYAPVVICGQETPQRDDNALMSRVVICEVAKPRTDRTAEERRLFDELKMIEDPDRVGLSNILFEILKLRPLVMEHFRNLKSECYDDLKSRLSVTGEIDRLMKTISLFLATCKLIEEYTELKLPFTYKEFLTVAINKIKFQIELISKTDKLASFFKAMDVMIDTKAIREGRDYDIGDPDKLTIKLPGGEKKEVAFPAGTRVLFIRLSTIYTQFARSSYNQEESTQSTIEQNLRSHPSYIGLIHARRFNWLDVVEVPHGGIEIESGEPSADNTMIRKMEKKGVLTSCIALNYNIFRELYDIDLQRSDAPGLEQELPDDEKPF